MRDGTVVGAGTFNAILRDYGRLRILLANDGESGGKADHSEEPGWPARRNRLAPAAGAFRPFNATPYFGYGYQFWLFPGDKRRFALLGVYGQSIFVDPELKLVLVLTAARRPPTSARNAGPRARCAPGAASSPVSAAGSDFLFGVSRGMHLRAGVTPDCVILAPETSRLICPAGQGSIIDQHALTEPEAHDILLAPDIQRERRHGECGENKQKRERCGERWPQPVV